MSTTRTLRDKPQTQEILSNLLAQGVSHSDGGAGIYLYVLTVAFFDPHASYIGPDEVVCRAAKILQLQQPLLRWYNICSR